LKNVPGDNLPLPESREKYAKTQLQMEHSYKTTRPRALFIHRNRTPKNMILKKFQKAWYSWRRLHGEKLRYSGGLKPATLICIITGFIVIIKVWVLNWRCFSIRVSTFGELVFGTSSTGSNITVVNVFCSSDATSR
jgi:hypothetical protein